MTKGRVPRKTADAARLGGDLERKAPASRQNAGVDIRGKSKSDIEQSCNQHSSYAD